MTGHRHPLRQNARGLPHRSPSPRNDPMDQEPSASPLITTKTGPGRTASSAQLPGGRSGRALRGAHAHQVRTVRTAVGGNAVELTSSRFSPLTRPPGSCPTTTPCATPAATVVRPPGSGWPTSHTSPRAPPTSNWVPGVPAPPPCSRWPSPAAPTSARVRTSACRGRGPARGGPPGSRLGAFRPSRAWPRRLPGTDGPGPGGLARGVASRTPESPGPVRSHSPPTGQALAAPHEMRTCTGTVGSPENPPSPQGVRVGLSTAARPPVVRVRTVIGSSR